jgi:hypothetical protein
MNPAKLLAGAAASIVLWAGAFGVATAQREDCDAVAQSVRAQLASACPCDAADAHGGHVRCVTKKLRELSECKKNATGMKDCGPVPRQCLGKIRRVASSSTCGQPQLITCCIPRQEDCRNDPHLGDGKAEGTCGRTKKPCDKLDDCVVPRCQAAASPDRCVAVGGTVGKGGDCNTACIF